MFPYSVLTLKEETLKITYNLFYFYFKFHTTGNLELWLAELVLEVVFSVTIVDTKYHF